MGGGGVSGGQRNTAVGNLADTGSLSASNQAQQYNRMAADQKQATDFYTNRMNKGLPFYRNLTDYNSGTVAQAFAPARADILRRTSQTFGPSGYRDALLADLGASQGRAFDSTLTQAMMANEMAKQQGAEGVTGQESMAGNQALGYGSQTMGANTAILGGPGKPSVGGVLGGIAQGALNAGTQLGSAYLGRRP